MCKHFSSIGEWSASKKALCHASVCPGQTAHLRPWGAVVNSTGSSSNFSSIMQQAVDAIGNYRSDLQSQLPTPVSSLTQLKGVNILDTALTAQACSKPPVLMQTYLSDLKG